MFNVRRRGERDGFVEPRPNIELKMSSNHKGDILKDKDLNLEARRDAEHQPLLTVKDIAVLLHVSKRHIWRLRSSARFPNPIKIGRAARWTQRSIMQFIENGGTSNVR